MNVSLLNKESKISKIMTCKNFISIHLSYSLDSFIIMKLHFYTFRFSSLLIYSLGNNLTSQKSEYLNKLPLELKLMKLKGVSSVIKKLISINALSQYKSVIVHIYSGFPKWNHKQFDISRHNH